MNEPTLRQTLRWLSYAQADILAAKQLMTQGALFSSQICFLSQQAAEKAIKASLVFLQIKFPYSHDLNRLTPLLPKQWQTFQQYSDLETLSNWAVDSRYPNPLGKPSVGEAVEALNQAEEILQSIQEKLKMRGLELSENKSVSKSKDKSQTPQEE
ncbi:MAG: HEPN domain-containing protein [Phormidesmis sp.]